MFNVDWELERWKKKLINLPLVTDTMGLVENITPNSAYLKRKGKNIIELFYQE